MSWESLASPFVAIARWIYDSKAKNRALEAQPSNDLTNKIAQIEVLLIEVNTLKHHLQNRQIALIVDHMSAMSLKVARRELSLGEFETVFGSLTVKMLRNEWGTLLHAVNLFLMLEKHPSKAGFVNDKIVLVKLVAELLSDNLEMCLTRLKHGEDI